MARSSGTTSVRHPRKKGVVARVTSAIEPGAARNGKRLDRYELRSHIVRKAAGVFGKRGAAETTVEDILQAAEISRRTFYKFFQSKEDVLDALHEIGCNMLIGAAHQMVATPGEPLERVKHALDAYFDYHVSVGANVMYVVQGEAMRAGSKLAPRRRALLDTLAGIFADKLGQAWGQRVDPLLLRSLLIAAEGLSMALRADSSNGSIDFERAKRIMLRIIMATIAAPPSRLVPPLPELGSPAR
jgi:AcrR family transcriptional regulator